MTDVFGLLKTRKLVLAIIASIMVSGCFADQANRIPAAQSDPAAKPDDAGDPALAAGLLQMQGRILRKVAGFGDIVPTPTSRYFMHPAVDRDAVMEFDVSNLSSLTLSPLIGALDAGCLADPDAGVVALSYAVDDAKPTRIVVDRSYDQLIAIDFAGSKKLTVVVNKANAVITCDWFGLGFMNVRAR
jgi:hypothetical protein